MMIVSEMADQKRTTLHHPFLLSPKRLKTATGAGRSTTQEKKDKIGEKVAALQQLVSPFGKSDTASVLTEAAAYINFLHEQLQKLSFPYLRSSPNGRSRQGDGRRSLRSRGLCLMPAAAAAAAAMIARGNGADIWAPLTK